MDSENKALIGIFMLVLLLVAGSSAFFYFRPAEIDAQTLCRKGEPLVGHKIIIIDKTDEWSTHNGDVLETDILRLVDGTKENEKVTIIAFNDENLANLIPVLSICNPGNGEEDLGIYRGKQYAYSEYKRSFAKPLAQILNELKKPNKSSNTHLLEVMSGVLVAYSSELNLHDVQFFIYSDMRQNSELFSFFGNTDYSSKNFDDAVGQALESNEKNISIDLRYIELNKPYKFQQEQLKIYWKRALSKAGFKNKWRQLN